VAQFMKEMLEGAGPRAALGCDATILRDLFDRTAGRLDELHCHPKVEADLRFTLGNIYFDLGEYGKAGAMHRRALAIRHTLFGSHHLDVADSLHGLARVLFEMEKADEAASLFLDALTIKKTLLGDRHPSVADSLYGLICANSHDPDLLSQAYSVNREPAPHRGAPAPGPIPRGDEPSRGSHRVEAQAGGAECVCWKFKPSIRVTARS
jgi:tetratricopeptide (TPR) repeat protein